MPEELTKDITPAALPVVPLRDIIVYPLMVAPVVISRGISINALDTTVNKDEMQVVLVAQKDIELEIPEVSDLYKYGILAKVIQILKFPDGSIKAIVEGISRVKVKSFYEENDVYFANISDVKEKNKSGDNTKALLRVTIDKFEEYVKKNHRMSPENLMALASISNDPGRMADIIATYLEIPLQEKQKVIEILDTFKRLEYISGILEREMEMLNIEYEISKKLKKSLSKTQKEYYLKEKLKIINEELHGKENLEEELEDYKKRIDELNLAERYNIKLHKEIKRLAKTPSYSSEYSVIKTYIDRIIELPWNISTEDINDINRAKIILDEDHWGLEEVKERIIEFLAVRKLSKQKQATILCLVGPPGVGKTSLAKSVARSLNRKFSYISLGGINDESEIRGHRKTYVGSMPGRIIQAIEGAGTRNPVILLDEIEKMMKSHMGDPTAALLEVLDPEQNINFTDHYVDIPFNLSEVFFIATANTLDTVYKALKDRLEVIKISGYTEEEKLNIAKKHLVPKQLGLHGLSKSKLTTTDKAIRKIINEYTKEAGVRNLERSFAKICRKAATQIVRGEDYKIRISGNNLEEYLGVPKFLPSDNRKENEIGVINGLAWTEAGGDVLYIESNLMPGKGDLNMTGSLGDVMKESAKIALSYIRSNHEKFKLPQDLQEKYDIHVHVPDGATPKDGPSAGLAITLAIISALTEKPIRSDIALTGEVTLRGKVLPIGGLKEKVLAAIRSDIHTIILPERNRKDIDDMPEYLNDQVNYIYVDNINQALEHIFFVDKSEQVFFKI